MRNTWTIVSVFSILALLFSCNITDGKDEIYNPAPNTELKSDSTFVKIGNQLWSRKNLNVSVFRNGDKIPEVKTNAEWEMAGKAGQPAWCYFDNNPKNDSLYGKIYNWYAVNNPRGLAPMNAHVASNEEWIQLIDFLGGKTIAGEKMKSTQGWSYGNGSNESQFSATPAGERHGDGEFSSLGRLTAWWTSSEYDFRYAWEYYMYDFSNGIKSNDVNKSGGFSVRCIKN